MSEDLLIAGSRRSWSQMDSWLKCGNSYRLQRILDTPETPSVWLPAGKAFHSATELLDKGEETDAKVAWFRCWNDEIAQATAATDVPLGEWRSAGRITKDKPNGESASWWMQAGAQMVQDYQNWLQGSGWQIAEFNGAKAIEMELNASVGGIPIKGFIDRIFVTPDGELIITDIKTGTRVPWAGQNALYASLLEATIGVRPSYGSYYMARKAVASPPESVGHLDLDYWGYVLSAFDRAVSNDIFIPNPGPLCSNCGVKSFCIAVGGENAHLVSLSAAK